MGDVGARLRTVPGGDGNGLVVHLDGALDIAGLPQIQADLDRLLTQPPQPVLIDLSGVGFLDSTGLTVLVRIANHFAEVRTRGSEPAVRRVIEALGLGGRLGLEEV